MKTKKILTKTLTTKMTDSEFERVASAAAALELSVSQLVRKILLGELDVSREARLILEFQVMGEERVRLLLVAAQKQKNVDSPDVQADINRQVLLTAPSVAADRLTALARLRPDLDWIGNHNAK